MRLALPAVLGQHCITTPSLPPDTGASTIRSSRSARRAAKSQLPDGAIVEQSTTRVPGRAPATSPSGANRTASTSGVSGTMVMITSAFRATSAADAQATPPAATRSPGTFLRVLRNSSWPPLIRCAAMGAPMMPRPMNPAFMCPLLMFPLLAAVDQASAADKPPPSRDPPKSSPAAGIRSRSSPRSLPGRARRTGRNS